MQLLPDIKSWLQFATKPEIVLLLPADTNVVLSQRQLLESFHSDPDDRLITATSILLDSSFATQDKRIRVSNVCEI